eukprot:1023426-Pyramimonas_sp.AAC.1
MSPGSQEFTHEPGRGEVGGARLGGGVKVLCDWGVPHARSNKLNQQSGVQEVEGVPVGKLARACCWMTL